MARNACQNQIEEKREMLVCTGRYGMYQWPINMAFKRFHLPDFELYQLGIPYTILIIILFHFRKFSWAFAPLRLISCIISFVLSTLSYRCAQNIPAVNTERMATEYTIIILDAAFISVEAIFAKSSDRGGTKRSVETTSFPCFGSHSQSFMDWENFVIELHPVIALLPVIFWYTSG